MRRKLTARQVQRFQRKIRAFYHEQGRTLPWRQTVDPYRILVSEVMLQQTQVDRVIQKYIDFIKKFPTMGSLARAPQSRVLAAWQGLGYNRRAIALKKASQIIMKQHGGKVPSTLDELTALSGIGHHTASSILAFAFKKPTVFIETNIRSVFIHEFFPRKKKVHDTELIPLVKQTLDSNDSRQWYSALMDYGSMLKKQRPNPSRRSTHHIRQSPFKGSYRELRGMILKTLLSGTSRTVKQLSASLCRNALQVKMALFQLEQEGFIKQKGLRYAIA